MTQKNLYARAQKPQEHTTCMQACIWAGSLIMQGLTPLCMCSGYAQTPSLVEILMFKAYHGTNKSLESKLLRLCPPILMRACMLLEQTGPDSWKQSTHNPPEEVDSPPETELSSAPLLLMPRRGLPPPSSSSVAVPIDGRGDCREDIWLEAAREPVPAGLGSEGFRGAADSRSMGRPCQALIFNPRNV